MERLKNNIYLHFVYMLIFVVAGSIIVHITDSGYVDIVYNSLAFFCCFQLFKTDFGCKRISLAKEITGNSLSHRIILGIGYGFAYAIILFMFLNLVFERQPALPNYSVPVILWWFVARLISTFGEELVFRYYFYEIIRSFSISVKLSAFVASLLYFIVFLLTNQGLLTALFALGLSLFLFYLRLSNQKESYLTLSVCHFVYNFIWLIISF